MTKRTAVRAEWQTNCHPPTNHVVYVWYFAGEVRGVWTGKRWQTPDGLILDGVTHWREMDK